MTFERDNLLLIWYQCCCTERRVVLHYCQCRWSSCGHKKRVGRSSITKSKITNCVPLYNVFLYILSRSWIQLKWQSLPLPFFTLMVHTSDGRSRRSRQNVPSWFKSLSLDVRKDNRFKFVLEVTFTVEDALVPGKQNGNALWKYAINKEMKNSRIDFYLLDRGENSPIGFEESHSILSLM